MPVVVPGNGADRAARTEAHRLQGIGQLARTRRALGIGIAEQRTVGFAGNDFDIAELAGGMFDDAGNEQGTIHHQAGLQHCLAP